MTQEEKDQALAIALADAPTLYHYDYRGGTWQYLGSSKADHDPGEWEINDQLQWMIPSGATLLPPLICAEDSIAVFNQETQEWQVVLKDVLQVVEEGPLDVTLGRQITLVCQRIDAEVDDFIYSVIGNRAQEYLQAEQAALLFKAHNYPALVPQTILADAEAFDRSPKEAAEAILAQADKWRGTQIALRQIRLKHKQRAGRAADINELAIVLQSWADSLKDIKEGL